MLIVQKYVLLLFNVLKYYCISFFHFQKRESFDLLGPKIYLHCFQFISDCNSYYLSLLTCIVCILIIIGVRIHFLLGNFINQTNNIHIINLWWLSLMFPMKVWFYKILCQAWLLNFKDFILFIFKTKLRLRHFISLIHLEIFDIIAFANFELFLLF